jgi:hypothetical protein
VNRFLSIAAAYFIILVASITIAQDIYVYPNKRLADQGLIEYRRYTLEEARAYQQGGSFEPYLTTGWSTERQLTQQSNVYEPSVVTLGDAIYCGYGLMLGSHTYFIKSTNGGIDWEPYVTLIDTTHVYLYLCPQITQYANNLLIGFANQDQSNGNCLGYFKSTDNGASWGSLRNILPSFDWRYDSYSSFSNSGRDLYAAYIDFSLDSIRVIRSWNFGTNWIGTGVNVAFLNSTPQPMSMAASDSIVHLVWVNEYAPISIRYSRSTDNGVTWSPEFDVSQDSLGAQRCFVSAEGQHVVVTWMGFKNGYHSFTGDIFIRQSFDGGLTWDTAQALTDLHYVWMGSNYIKDSLIVVTWQDDRYHNQNLNSEIFARYSTSNGQTWLPEERLSNGVNDSDSPIATSTGSLIHVLWGDRRPEAAGLYYINNNLHDNIENEVIQYGYSQITSYPNPFNSLTIIKYPANEGGEIEIYNLLGQQVKALRVSLNGGQVVWDGTDNQNKSVPTGVYFARVKSSGISIGAKLLLIK